jgi:amino acid adenylation domain-containing protein
MNQYAPIPEFTTLVHLLRQRARQQPNQTAYTYLVDGETQEVHITYSELERRARAIGARVQRLAAGGDRVLVLCPQGLDYIAAYFGSLFAGAIAVTSYPPRDSQLDPRLRAITLDAGAKIVLTTSGMLEKLENRLHGALGSQAFHAIAVDEVNEDWASAWQEPEIAGESVAFIQYTSGSTESPKGVMVTHSNLVHNLAMLKATFQESTERFSFVSWLPIFHDLGLISAVLESAYVGGSCVLLSPSDFLRRPLRWLQAIDRYHATISGGPNFAYDLCVEKIKPEERARLDLSRWKIAINGAEPIRHATLERFARTFSGCGFRPEFCSPGYGLAEATLYVSRASRSVVWRCEPAALEQGRVTLTESAGRPLVSCGPPASGLELVIVDPKNQTRALPDRVGEIWLSAPSVAKGYWNRPEETRQTFQAYLADSGQGPFLRTGDLGFLKEGELVVTGRLKDLIIIRGRNHYPQDLELTAEQSHTALRPGCVVAFSTEAAGEERLVMVAEVARSLPKTRLEEVTQAIRQSVSKEHEIQPYTIVLVRARSLPMTSSGKIQRRACRAQFLEGWPAPLAMSIGESGSGDNTSSPAGENSLLKKALSLMDGEKRQIFLENYLQDLISRQIRIAASAVTPQDRLRALGLDSLAAAELQRSIETTLGITIPAVDFLGDLTLAQLATRALHQLSQPAKAWLPLVRRTSGTDHLPLSFSQQGLWFLDQMAPNNPFYNLPAGVELRGQLDAAVLHRALNQIIRRHESLRTIFPTADGQAVQCVLPFQEAPLPVTDLTEIPAKDRELEAHRLARQEARRPFNLSTGPLIRYGLFKLSDEKHWLIIILHHIVGDGWSMGVLLRELTSFYAAFADGVSSPLPELPVQYPDYALWQRNRLTGEEFESHIAYWKTQLEDMPEMLNLPTDRGRPMLPAYKGALRNFKLSASVTGRLKGLGHQGTLFMILLAAFKVMLRRYTGQDDLAIGSPTANRNSTSVESLIGLFVNTLVLRTNLAGDPSFRELLERVRKVTLDAYAHQDVPLGILVQRLQPERDLNRNPLIQVLFVLQGVSMAPRSASGLTLTPFEIDSGTAPFDLTLSVREEESEIVGSLSYSADLFDDATADRMVEHLRVLIEAIGSNPDARISTLPLLTQSELQELSGSWKRQEEQHLPHGCLHSLFEQQVRRRPEAIAVTIGGEHVTYEALNAEANRLARYLRRGRIGPDKVVAVCMDRSPRAIIALLAILKAGAAYLPIDPGYPKDLIAFMLEDSEASLLLAEEPAVCELPHAVAVSRLNQQISAEAEQDLADRCHAKDLAYVIYTSGSTGRPKGVAMEHGPLLNLMHWQARSSLLSGPARTLQFASFSFDVSFQEIFFTLSTGGTLVMIDEDTRRDPVALLKVLDEAAVERAFLPLVALQQLARVANELGKVPACLREVITAGEQLQITPVIRRFFEHLPGCVLHNQYGPTESHAATALILREKPSEWKATPSIGHPVDNAFIRVLDEYENLVPVGVQGGLYIGGAILARGYFGNPGLTSEHFIPDAFASAPGARLYRTGDMARILPRGCIDFLGRRDFQVKVRGFRVELGQIEAVLAQHPDVKQVVVLATDDKTNKRLVAYIVSVPGTNLSASSLQAFAAARLPDFMLPAAFMFFDSFPLTRNNKVDRRALPPPALSSRQPGGDFVLPTSPVEKTLARIWGDLLEIEAPGIHDDFFKCGGHSLLATQLISRVRDTFGVDLPVRKLFGSPTIAGLAQALNEVEPRNFTSGSETLTFQDLEDVRI